ncbi:gamma-glutamylcyclotransferase [Nocardia sp. CDC159]|uniref:Putative gamma-glutamylcyclotransferase n=1 Tax=Nocardia pulmonis TaxID=2951408 RepID=A0A9X2E4Q5_9NOCA|nr:MULTISPECIES: gamma-glutamylcyclotransferase family protein [Nocardia]MCM6774267.1 gamma-glutamylcyclotransferase [Nocardia pulmonis]MCM6787154.1 gamma-glutamylcyclotransferase [Nocardia sp. CDC159]
MHDRILDRSFGNDPAIPAAVVGMSRLPGVGERLFVYGTLQFGPVLEELIGRTPDCEVAVVRDWRVATLPGRLYPGLVAAPGRMAAGLVLEGLTPAEWEVLDAFEDEEYELRAIEVIGRTDPVPTYVWTAEVGRNDWVPEVFAADHLDRFVERSARWRREAAHRTAGQ